MALDIKVSVVRQDLLLGPSNKTTALLMLKRWKLFGLLNRLQSFYY